MISDAFRQLAHSSNGRLAAIFNASPAPALDSLIGYEWSGYNVSPIIRLLGLQKFIKGFFWDGDHVEGYNTPVLQNGIDGAWVAQPDAHTPKRFGFYTVTPVEPHSKENLHPN